MLEKVDWAIPNRLLIVRYSHYVIREDILRATQEVNSMLSTIDTPRSVHLIFDATSVIEFNLDMNVSKAREYAKAVLLNPILNWTVFASVHSQHPIFMFISDIVIQLLRLRVKRVNTIDEAILYLMEKDPSLFTKWEDKRTLVTFS